MPQLVRALLLLTACILLQPAMALDNKPMTNQDVINMAKAQLPENTIVMAIQAARPAFDTSANGLIKLKTAGVPQGVIEAVIAASSQGGGSSSASLAGAWRCSCPAPRRDRSGRRGRFRARAADRSPGAQNVAWCARTVSGRPSRAPSR